MVSTGASTSMISAMALRWQQVNTRRLCGEENNSEDSQSEAGK
jgi:hypothetical protein